MCLTAVDVQAERVDDGVQSTFGSTLRLTAPWRRFHGVPYRQEKACPEAFVRAIRTHTSCPWNATAAAAGRTCSSAAATDAARRVARRSSRPRGPTPEPPAQPRAREPVLAGQGDQVLGPERGLERRSSPAGSATGRGRRIAGQVARRDRAPRRSSAAGGGRRDRAVAGRPARAAPHELLARRVRVDELALEIGNLHRRPRPTGSSRACAPARSMRSPAREPGDVARLDVGRIALDQRLRRELAVVVARLRGEGAPCEIRKCSSCSACVTSCAITERGAAPPEPST